MIRVQVTDKILTTARQWESEILKRLPDRANYTGWEAKDRYFKGFLGELAFSKLCWDFKKKVVYHVNLTGKSGGADFTVYFKGLGEREMDSKCSVTDDLLISQRQHQSNLQRGKDISMYLGSKVDREYKWVEVYGFAFIDELKVVDGNYSCKLTSIQRSVEYLLKNLDSGIPIIDKQIC